MNMLRYTFILALIIGISACGVRRDLKLPKDEKPASEQSETAKPSEE